MLIKCCRFHFSKLYIFEFQAQLGDFDISLN